MVVRDALDGKGRAHSVRNGHVFHGTGGWEGETLGRCGVSVVAGERSVECSVKVGAKTFLKFEAGLRTPLHLEAQQPTASNFSKRRRATATAPRPPHTYGPAPGPTATMTSPKELRGVAAKAEWSEGVWLCRRYEAGELATAPMPPFGR